MTPKFNKAGLDEVLEAATSEGTKFVMVQQAPEPTSKHTYEYEFDEQGLPSMRYELTTEFVDGAYDVVPTRVTKATTLTIISKGKKVEFCKGFQWTIGIWQNGVQTGSKPDDFWEIPKEAGEYLVEQYKAGTLKQRCQIDYLHQLAPNCAKNGLVMIAFGDRCDQITGIGKAKAARKAEAISNAMDKVSQAMADRKNAQKEAALENHDIG